MSEFQQWLDLVTTTLQRESTDVSCVSFCFNGMKPNFTDFDGSDMFFFPTARKIRSPIESVIVDTQDAKQKGVTTNEQLASKNLRQHTLVKEDVPGTCGDFASMNLND